MANFSASCSTGCCASWYGCEAWCCPECGGDVSQRCCAGCCPRCCPGCKVLCRAVQDSGCSAGCRSAISATNSHSRKKHSKNLFYLGLGGLCGLKFYHAINAISILRLGLLLQLHEHHERKIRSRSWSQKQCQGDMFLWTVATAKQVACSKRTLHVLYIICT